MPKTEPLDAVLDGCLARVQSGAATVEDCLREHPELADQLAPLLRAARQAGELAPSGPTVAFRTASQARVLNRLRAAQSTGRAGPPRAIDRPARRRPFVLPGSWRTLKPAYALAGLALAVALISSGVGVAGAAAESLPGDRLYAVKLGAEQVALTLSPTGSGDASLLLEFAGRRLDEAKALIDLGRDRDLPVALAGYERELDRLFAQGHRSEESLARLEAALAEHQRALDRALQRAAPEGRQAIQRALEHSRRGQDQVRQERQEQGPDRVPPGQLRRTPPAEDEAEGQNRGQDKDKTRTPGPPSDLTRGPKDKEP